MKCKDPHPDPLPEYRERGEDGSCLMRLVSVCALAAIFPLSVFAQVTQQPQPPLSLTQPPPRAAPQTLTMPTDTAQNTSALMRSNGGSLLRASLAAQTDPSIAKA